MKELREKLIQNKIIEVVNGLLNHPLSDSSIRLSVELINSKFNLINDNYRKGILNTEDNTVELLKINQSLLELLTILEGKGNKAKKNNFQNHTNERIVKYSVIGFANSGTTTFLTVLINELILKGINSVTFQIADEQTENLLDQNDRTIFKNIIDGTQPIKEFEIYNLDAIQKHGLEIKKYNIKIGHYTLERRLKMVNKIRLHKPSALN